MPIHIELLALAREMVDRNPAAPVESELRRAVSTAYYALFHLLIHEGTARLVAKANLRSRVARTFEHKFMSAVCKEFGALLPNTTGQYIHGSGTVIPAGVITIAAEFVTLQDARLSVDYDTAIVWEYTEAEDRVASAELAFGEWPRIQAEPGTDLFLAELWCRGIPKRN
ncbi:hypothetical protein BH10PLA2_BH10PLA2_39160 [soil metagenome]